MSGTRREEKFEQLVKPLSSTDYLNSVFRKLSLLMLCHLTNLCYIIKYHYAINNVLCQ